MKKGLKILAGLAAGLLLALVLAAWLLPRLVDSEALKQRLATEVSSAAGRPVRISGELGFSLFPPLSVEVGGVSFGTPDKPDEPAGSVELSRVQVALRPLLNGQILVKGLHLEGAELFFRDEQAGLDLRLSGATVRTGAISLPQIAGAAVPLEVSGLLEDAGGAFSRQFELGASAWLDPDAQRYRFDQLDLLLQNPANEGPPLRILATEALLDLAGQTLTLDGLKILWAGLEMAGQLRLKELQTQPGFNGRLASQAFSPRALLEALGLQPPATADAGALETARFSVLIEGNQARLALKQLDLQLDDSRISGEVVARNPDQPVLKFDLDIDRIDLDRYLPPASEEPGGRSRQAGAIALPIGGLTMLQANGALRIGELHMLGMALTGAEAQVTSANGAVRLHPIRANVFGGRYSGDIRLEASGQAPIISFDESLQAVELGQLARQLGSVENISGTATGRIQGVGTGLTSEELVSSLVGAVSLQVADGALEGVDVWYQVRTALALLRGAANDSADTGRTVFSRLQLEADIADGLLTTDTLTAQLPFLELAGNGSVNLGEASLDLGLTAALRKLPELQEDPLTSGLVGRSLPLRISGPLSAPAVGVDAGELLRGELGARLRDRLGLGKPGDEAEPGDTDPLEKQVRGLLNELLGGDRQADEQAAEDP